MQQPVLFLLKRTLLGGGVGPWTPGLRQGFLDRILRPALYIDPSLGSGSNNGTSWANAFNTATAWTDAIAASSVNGNNDFYVNAASNASNASNQTLAFKGTAAAPDRIFSCSGVLNNPPLLSDLAAGAQFTTTGASSPTVTGFVYIYGVVFNCGTGANFAGMTLASGNYEQTLDTCAIKLLCTTNNNSVVVAGSFNSKLTLINTPITVNGGTGSQIQISTGTFIWRNTLNAVQGTQAAIANLIAPQGTRGGLIIVDGVDFIGTTGIASGKNLVAASAGAPFAIQFVDCKVNSGVLIARPTQGGTVIDQIIVDSGATGYKQQRDTYQGTLIADTTHYNNASDGTTPISWQVTTTANATPQSPFECFTISQWVPAGTYAASKIFLTSTNAGLNSDDVWAEVNYLGSNYALSSPGTSFGAGSGSTTLSLLPAGSKGAPLAAASPAWAVGSLGSDYQLAIPSFTTSAPGLVRFNVKIGKPSILVNVDGAAKVA